MKSASELIHKTPWWALLTAGLALALGLAVFVTPFELLRLQKSGATPEENRAIKREVDLTFSEGAINLARGVVTEMRQHAKDPARREELDRALEQIETARESLHEADAEARRAKREAARDAAQAAREAARAIREAQKEAKRALKAAGVDNPEVQRSLEASLAAATKAEREARRTPEPPAEPQAPGVLPAEPEAPATPSAGPGAPATPPAAGMPAVPNPPAPPSPLSPQERAQIRDKVTGDLWRMGVGAGLILLFIPLFILIVVAKFFIDRSRAAQRMAELKRKEAEYHRMSQQVTEAKLSALQAQVEPHFLYNTLASVQALTEVDPQRANEMTGHLIQYLRNALPKMRESVSTVGQEVELVRAYLNILQMRMGKRLAFTIDVPQELMELAFPPLMLPSLVENAIKHGLEPQREGGEVRIRGEAIDGTLRIVVEDTGRGFGDAPGSGVGLANIRERLEAMYGDRGHLTLVAREPRGVTATIEVPRDGARATGEAFARAATASSTASAAAAAQAPQPPRGKAARTLAAIGTAERAWRKGLSFTFIGLVVVAAVVAGLGIIGIATGLMPVQISGTPLGGASGTVIGAAGIAAAFAVVVLALAIVLAVVYGLGFLFAGLAIFIPLVVLVAIFPVLSPLLLLGLVIWWLMRRADRRRKAEAAAPSP